MLESESIKITKTKWFSIKKSLLWVNNKNFGFFNFGYVNCNFEQVISLDSLDHIIKVYVSITQTLINIWKYSCNFQQVINVLYILWSSSQLNFRCPNIFSFWNILPKILKIYSKLRASQKLEKYPHQTSSRSNFLCLNSFSSWNI